MGGVGNGICGLLLVHQMMSCPSKAAICVPQASVALRGLVQPSRTPGVSGLGLVSPAPRVLVVRERHGDNLSRQGTAYHPQACSVPTAGAGTTSTAHGASRRTRSATLPMKKRVTPWRP